ncbi:Ubiquitin-conjugating enzyme E2 G2 [Chionoecetes opilio]|uniref:Ubiquitin-conjugating enzyme E2 G2 n=1 Tax=Chionoecetes opilio TaxID=41210 RepID=A0A8J4Y589_CHIOP|nr:Ubiquitin-conjugating enzyme E2 G2 [Chionoecetes opilio]
MDWALGKLADQSDCGASLGNTKITDLVFADDAVIFEPNDESSANVDAAKMWRDDREQFNKIAERLVRKTLNLPHTS